MAISIRRLIRDLNSTEIDVRMLALNTVLRLNKENLDATEGYHELTDKLEDLGNSQEAEEQTLARRGWNHLRELAPAFRLAPVTARQSVLASGSDLNGAAVVVKLSAARNPEEIVEILQRARAVHDPKLVPPLAPYARHADPEVRYAAIEALESSANSEQMVAIIAPLVRDHEDRVRAQTARSLLRIGPDKVRQVLKMMLTSQNVGFRETAAFALGHLKGAGFPQVLAEALADPVVAVRIRAIRGVAMHKFRECLPELTGQAQSPDPGVAPEAQRAIRILKGQEIDEGDAPSELHEMAELDSENAKKNAHYRKVQDEMRGEAQRELERIEQALKRGGASAQRVEIEGKSLREIEGMIIEELQELGRVAVECCRVGLIKEPDAMTHYYDFLKFHDLLEKRKKQAEADALDSGFLKIVRNSLSIGAGSDPVKALEDRVGKSLEMLGKLIYRMVEGKTFQHPDTLLRAGRVRALLKHREKLASPS